MQGAAHDAVVLHRECAATQQMWYDRLALEVKNDDEFTKRVHAETVPMKTF
jgi:hypothetical protein